MHDGVIVVGHVWCGFYAFSEISLHSCFYVFKLDFDVIITIFSNKENDYQHIEIFKKEGVKIGKNITHIVPVLFMVETQGMENLVGDCILMEAFRRQVDNLKNKSIYKIYFL